VGDDAVERSGVAEDVVEAGASVEEEASALQADAPRTSSRLKVK
jgi:hypothetical protein